MSARMIELAYQTGSRLELAFAHNSAGELYRLAGQYGKTIEHYQHARYWSLELSRDFAVAINSVNIALMYANQGQYDEALEQWNDVFRRLGQKMKHSWTRCVHSRFGGLVCHRSMGVYGTNI